MTDPDDYDENLWLEEIDSPRALGWVRERNAETIAALSGPEFETLRASIREVLDADDRIPYVTRRGAYRYNFWRDAEHPRGLWRRTTPESYRSEQPVWETVLDVDRLAADEGENWVWDGATVLRPDYTRALVSLSRGGADASVVREYDLARREFVADGFVLPEAKTSIDWIDADRIYVATDFGPDTLTTAGLPRTVREWRRGTPLADAELVYAGEPTDSGVSAWHDDTPGFERDFVSRSVDFYRTEWYLRDGAALRRIPVPDDAIAAVQRDWLLIELRSDWPVAGTTHPAGSLLATRFEEFLAGGATAAPELVVLFAPDDHTALAGWSWTRHRLIVTELRDVSSHLRVLTPAESGPWHAATLTALPAHSDASAFGTDSDEDDEYQLTVESFLTPSTVHLGTAGAGDAVPVKHEPRYFDATGLAVRQQFTASADGTKVPYFVVGPDTDEPLPTLLYGYGGFEISLLPGYSGVIGRAWLARGFRYAVANTRGGAEYGSPWHTAALRANRRRVYDDFAAVATDLTERGLTTPSRLGILGGSNGGLLTALMAMRRPELFGAAVSEVPLTDMRRYHRLLAGALWVPEYGDPDVADDWAFLREFSPYHQIRPDGEYPPLLFTTSTRDDRVHPGHARKMVARLRAAGHDVSYYENIEGGHAGAADNAQAAFLSALVHHFLHRHLAGTECPR
ncbi:prolyl oligopeptidase [Actinocatenispora thailandica]|uniref:Prolyl oligopeptidase n=1 Tax=Actinocatenispora thailandica TaxID=227318 RepID=A0A7R7I0A4_9ACTN|nr:prolyl oligopeptidase family serine peptidase [Actinocatenispora thailandica]BCJ37823.1 prolyl oligopeptidase [Actinocatenispora thailandica]